MLRLVSLARLELGGGVPHTFGVLCLRRFAIGRGAIERLEINRLNASRHASQNRLKTGPQTHEKTLAAASDSPSTLQPENGSSRRVQPQMDTDQHRWKRAKRTDSWITQKVKPFETS